MILDTRQWGQFPFEQLIGARRRVFVDGIERDLVWYVDTELGFARTYDVLGDGRAHSVIELTDAGKMASDWDNANGAASKTIFGRIELKNYEAHS